MSVRERCNQTIFCPVSRSSALTEQTFARLPARSLYILADSDILTALLPTSQSTIYVRGLQESQFFARVAPPQDPIRRENPEDLERAISFSTFSRFSQLCYYTIRFGELSNVQYSQTTSDYETNYKKKRAQKKKGSQMPKNKHTGGGTKTKVKS